MKSMARSKRKSRLRRVKKALRLAWNITMIIFIIGVIWLFVLMAFGVTIPGRLSLRPATATKRMPAYLASSIRYTGAKEYGAGLMFLASLINLFDRSIKSA